MGTLNFSLMQDTQFQELAPHYDELMNIVPYDFWAEYVMTLFNFVGHRPERLLDCACGTGNLSFELAKYGLHVTGVDLSQPMILQAKNKAKNENLPYPIEFHERDLTSFHLGRTFNAATCLYDSLNYILNDDELYKAFDRIRNHMEKDGVFVFDFNSIWAFEANLFTQSSRKGNSSFEYEWQANFDTVTRICTVQMDFKKKIDATSNLNFHEVHRERAYSIEEIKNIAVKTGWDVLHIFDAYTLNRPHQRSERWFFVARAV